MYVKHSAQYLFTEYTFSKVTDELGNWYTTVTGCKIDSKLLLLYVTLPEKTSEFVLTGNTPE